MKIYMVKWTWVDESEGYFEGDIRAFANKKDAEALVEYLELICETMTGKERVIELLKTDPTLLEVYNFMWLRGDEYWSIHEYEVY